VRIQKSSNKEDFGRKGLFGVASWLKDQTVLCVPKCAVNLDAQYLNRRDATLLKYQEKLDLEIHEQKTKLLLIEVTQKSALIMHFNHNKIPTTANPVLDVLKSRWSPRAFLDKAISDAEVAALVEAAGWAPSSMNQQPWRYLYAHKGTLGYDKMLSCILPGNAIWVKHAPLLMLNIGYSKLDAFDVPNPHFMHDCGMANANLFTQATSMGIYGHLLGGYDRERTIKTFDLNEPEEPVCFIALGFLGNPEQLVEPFKSRELAPRQRKSINEISQKLD
jgi:nitroreductase